MCLMSSRFFAIEGGTKMKKLLCLVVVLTGAVAYSSVLAGAYSSIVGLLSSFGTVSTLAYFALCVICVSALVVLRTKGGLPFGFFLIVLGGFFLGVASRSPSPSAEFHAGLGFTFFVVGSPHPSKKANKRRITFPKPAQTRSLRTSRSRLNGNSDTLRCAGFLAPHCRIVGEPRARWFALSKISTRESCE